VSGDTEDNVYIGDVFACGEALLQVTQAREPCWKLAYKFKQKKLPMWVISSGRTGWYMRVLKEGVINTSNALTLVEAGCQQWSVMSCNQLYHNKKLNSAKLESVLTCEGLSDSWRRSFEKRLEIALQLQSSRRD
jgi:MOSC domain-containing protein YiiM